ncbi:hypothetical protein VHEMI00028 [[Torrubiella] hemipterigena]|uniref:Ubiquitin fusion degradation protein (Ufd1) n=1 Tax=[Torrubiella] hemipterigena TaxID=1531966 RepID=A0A0A1T117_9HYPO|nr:hypothetical protein VHEMI00028 [[Torrubiella] hemipterigena]
MSFVIDNIPSRAVATACANQDHTGLTLEDLLHNSLVLAHIVPYLPASSILNLAATNSSFRSLLSHSPGVFRHLNLSTVKAAQFNIDQIDHGGEVWRNVQLDENLTEDDFYSGPLRGIVSTLRRRNILGDVQTLVLDGLSVTSDFVHDVINDPSYNIRILSLRETKNLNHGKLRNALQYACRPSRAEGMPRLKGVYIFGKKDYQSASSSSRHAHNHSAWGHQAAAAQEDAAMTQAQQFGDEWWNTRGRIYPRGMPDAWAQCLIACQGIIAFDAVLCQGPRHSNSAEFGKHRLHADSRPAVATYSVPGCAGCGKAPEGVLHPDTCAPASLPLLAPLPIMSSSLRAATVPSNPGDGLIARCTDCLRERYCSGCHKWWCEACYLLPEQAADSQPQIQILDDDHSAETLAFNDFAELDEVFTTATKFKSRLTKSCWECGTNVSVLFVTVLASDS